ncbi:MAG: hypothetical protein D6730_12000, partial [Bacteroidetes bacterium]
MKKLMLIFGLHCLLLAAFAQKHVSLSYYLPQNVQYDPSIPTPESFLGFQVGEWHVSHDRLM